MRFLFQECDQLLASYAQCEYVPVHVGYINYVYFQRRIVTVLQLCCVFESLSCLEYVKPVPNKKSSAVFRHEK